VEVGLSLWTMIGRPKVKGKASRPIWERKKPQNIRKHKEEGGGKGEEGYPEPFRWVRAGREGIVVSGGL